LIADLAHILDLFFEDSQLDVYADERDLRPPGAPTAQPCIRRTRWACGLAGSNRGLATNIICSFGDLRPDLARPRRRRTPSGLPMDDCCIASQPRRITIFARTCLHAALTRQQDNQKVMRSTPWLLKSCTFRRWCQELRLTLLPTRPFACSPISAVTCGWCRC